MFRRALTLGSALALALLASLLTAPPAHADHGYSHAPAFYLIPHQDDDVLSMGADMKIHAREADRPTYAVLLTDGSESGTCYKRFGDPNRTTREERKQTGLSEQGREDCTAVRDAEFELAMNRLGVTPIIRSDRKQDSCSATFDKDTSNPWKVADCTESNELKRAYVLDVIQEILDEHPNASLKGYTYKESLHCERCGYNSSSGTGHPDHDVIGEALRYAYNHGWTDDIRFFVKPSMWKHWPNINDAWHSRGINHVLNAYGEDSPLSDDSKWYTGIGHDSVETMFCEQYDAIHPGPSYCSDAQRTHYTDEVDHHNLSPGGSHNRIHYPGE